MGTGGGGVRCGACVGGMACEGVLWHLGRRGVCRCPGGTGGPTRPAGVARTSPDQPGPAPRGAGADQGAARAGAGKVGRAGARARESVLGSAEGSGSGSGARVNARLRSTPRWHLPSLASILVHLAAAVLRVSQAERLRFAEWACLCVESIQEFSAAIADRPPRQSCVPWI